ncbi:MAG: tRNA nucleotidyltransferase, partial [Chitinophagaceae bacterium]
MEIQFTAKEEKAFHTIAAAAENLGMPCYLIGGFVRDKILGRPTKDADFVCVGDALQ